MRRQTRRSLVGSLTAARAVRCAAKLLGDSYAARVVAEMGSTSTEAHETQEGNT